MKRLILLAALYAVPATAGTRVATNAVATVNWNAGVSYTYDGSGNVRRAGNDTFAYDNANRLVEATVNGSRRIYEYDAFGNRQKCTIATGGDCQFGVTVDQTRNRISGAGYDDAGNVSSFDGHLYTYDDANMTSRDAEGVNGPAKEFFYSADDQRIAIYDVGSTWSWTLRDVKGAVLREFTSADGPQGPGTASWSWMKDYVYRDSRLLASRQPAAAAVTTYHYHLDHIGTARRVTDQTGVTVGYHDYYAFGPEVSGGLTEASATNHKYTGHERDIWHGDNSLDTLDYMHARYYDPALAHFFSVDPGPDRDPDQPQSWNQYTYVRNNPMTFTDSTGRFLDFDFENGVTRQQIQRFLNSKLHGERATVDKSGNLTLTQVKAKGKATPEQKAFSDVLHAAVDRKETIKLTVTQNDAEVPVGQYITGKVDLGDVGQFRPSGAGSQASVFSHELAEQTAKQIFHLPDTKEGFDTAHRFGEGAQSYVAGYTRGTQFGGLTNGTGVTQTPHTDSRGQTVVVTVYFVQGNVVRVDAK